MTGERTLDPVIVTDHVSKWYGQVSALNDVSVNLPCGVTGLLGPNGAGKSTLMKIVTGQLHPSQGTVTVLGKPVWNNPHVYSQLGYCPEQDSFYERMTGLEFLTALLRLHGAPEADAQASAAVTLEHVSLADARHVKIGAYSKGMRQRIKLAQAIAHDPDVLVLDEPLAGLDPGARRRTIRFVREWGDSGKTVLVSSHVLHEVEEMTSHVLLMNQGRVLADGNLHDLRALLDEHPHTVHIHATSTRDLARALLAFDDVLSLRLEGETLVVQTKKPDAFYTRLTGYAASGEFGSIDEVTCPDDNLQAVFSYLVKT